MKKILCILISFILVLSLIAGCGGTQQNKGTEASKTDSAKADAQKSDATKAEGNKSDKQVTLTLIHYLVEKPKIQGLQNLVDGFVKKNQNVKIDIQSMNLDQYASVLKMKLAAGDSPNILFGNPKTYMDIVKAGNILDLSNQEFVKRIDDKFVSNVTIDGKVYGVPLDLMPSGVFYNKDIFKSAGVEVPKTWPEFIKVCDTLKSKGITPIAAGYKDLASIGGGCYTEIYGTPLAKMEDFRDQVMEGKKKLADYPEFKKFLQRFDQRNKYVNSDALQIGVDRAEQMFATGKTAMIVLGSWGIGAVRQYNPEGNFGIFMFPSSDDGNDLMSVGTDDTWMISTHADNQDISLKFFDHMTTVEAASQWATDLNVTSAIKGAKAAKLDPMAADLQAIFETGKIMNWISRNDFYGQFNDVWMKKLQELAFSQGTDIDKFIKGFDEAMDKARMNK